MKKETVEKIGYYIYCLTVISLALAFKMYEMGKFD
jgi:hypothetical protein